MTSQPSLKEATRLARFANGRYRDCEYPEILSIVWLALAERKNPSHAVAHYYSNQCASVYTDALAGREDHQDRQIIGSDAITLKSQGYTSPEIMRKLKLTKDQYYTIMRIFRNAMLKMPPCL